MADFPPDLRFPDLPSAGRKVVRADEPVDTQGPCGGCGEDVVPGAPDPCLGYLPGVKFACCGHGKHEGYIAFSNGTTIRGTFNRFEYRPFPR